MRKNVVGIAGELLLVLLGVAFAAPRCDAAIPTRIYVVAVHDSSLFTFCPPELREALASGDLWPAALTKPDFLRAVFAGGDIKPAPSYFRSFLVSGYRFYINADGRLGLSWAAGGGFGLLAPPPFVPEAPGILERSRPDWGELSSLATGVCPSGWMDFTMRKEIEAEFKNRKDYELVDSAEEAEFVFLVEGLYYTYWDPVSGGRATYSVTDTGPVFGRQMREVAVGVLVPAETYQRDPADSGAILQAALWTGVSYNKRPSSYQIINHGVDPYLNTRSASIKELVSRFVERSKWDSAIPPVCPAWLIRPGGAAAAGSGKRALLIGSDSEKQPAPAEKAGRAPAGNVIRTETVLVTVPVITSDENGAYVPDLTIRDFHVYENGIEQKIDRLIDESEPFHTALLMDASRSTLPVSTHIERAALSFLGSVRPEDELMALSLSNLIHVDSEFTLDRSRLSSAITDSAIRARAPYIGAETTKEPRKISPGVYRGTYSRITNEQFWLQGRFNGTRLYDALDLTVTERLDKIAGRKAILLFTDGVDTGSRLATAESTLTKIEESDILLYVVRYDSPEPTRPAADYRVAVDGFEAAYARGEQYLQALADHSGGRLFNASAGADLQAAFSYIAGELGHQYTLCYYPSEPSKDTAFRRIQVTVDKPGIKIRARAGYRPSLKAPDAK